MRVLNMIINIQNWPEYLYFKHLDKKKKSFLFKCHNGIKADVPRRMLHTFKPFLPGSIFLFRRARYRRVITSVGFDS